MKEHCLDDERYHPPSWVHPGTCPGCALDSPRWGVKRSATSAKLRALADKVRVASMPLAVAIDMAAIGDWAPLLAREEAGWKPRTRGLRAWRAAMDLRPAGSAS